MKIKLALLSDLHCHPKSEEPKSTYLFSDMLRTPELNHPVESISKLIEQEKIRTDITISLGDVTNKMNLQGFISGWNYILEIHDYLESEELISTIGNHDIDSRGFNSSYNLEIAKGIRKGFPMKDQDLLDRFWSKGGCFVELNKVRILIINSAHFHYNKENSKEGRVDHNFLDYISDYLEKPLTEKINIAISHHQPIRHPRLLYESEDEIDNGSDLLEKLMSANFDLYIHGHQHDPLIWYHHSKRSSKRIPILSTGSFSATSNQIYTGKRNAFHHVELTKEKSEPAKGLIKTWKFMPRSGWNNKNDQNDFPPNAGFGYIGSIRNLADQIQEIVSDSPLKKWTEVVSILPDIKHLTPEEAEELEKELEIKQLSLNGKLCELPSYISNTKNI